MVHHRPASMRSASNCCCCAGHLCCCSPGGCLPAARGPAAISLSQICWKLSVLGQCRCKGLAAHKRLLRGESSKRPGDRSFERSEGFKHRYSS
jgi:hypothetical protein